MLSKQLSTGQADKNSLCNDFQREEQSQSAEQTQLDRMMSESLSCNSARPKRIDSCQSMLTWLNAPDLTETEFHQRQQIVHLRLQLLDKIDEAHYIKRCIKLRTRQH